MRLEGARFTRVRNPHLKLRRLARTKEGGFTLIEVLVVVAILAILMAIAAPNFHGGSIVSADTQAQALARIAANDVADVFAETQTYRMIQPGQLGCKPVASCVPSGNLTWQGDGIPWIDYGQAVCGCTNQNTVTAIAPSNPNDGLAGADAAPGGDKTPNVVALLTRSDNTDGGSTAVAVTGAAPADDCWFVILHNTGGPPVYGYFDKTCDNFTSCWQEWPFAAPNYYATADAGCSWEGDNSKMAVNSFPADPNV